MNTLFQAGYIINTAIIFVWIALLISSILALSIIIERIIFLTRISSSENTFSQKVISLVKDKDIKSAILICETSTDPLANIILSGLQNTENPKEYMISQASKEIPKLERFISALSTISTISPLLGLLGTILGMIESFGVLNQVSAAASSALTNGIANALLTTAAGLIIAIPSVVSYNYFVQKINKSITFMENTALEISDIVVKNK